MNDMNVIRKEPETARTGIQNRGGRYLPALEGIIKLDVAHRDLLKKVEELRARRNASSQAVGKAKAAKNEAEAAKLMAEVSVLKTEMSGQEEALAGLSAKVREAVLGHQAFFHGEVTLGVVRQEQEGHVDRVPSFPAVHGMEKLVEGLEDGPVLIVHNHVPRLQAGVPGDRIHARASL